jgi:hypothetical protein
MSGTPGNNNWYMSNVTVTLTAQDKSGTGIKLISYCIDDQLWVTYSAPFTISYEGTTTVKFYSVDNASNQDRVQSANVRIDKTLPRITGSATTSPDFNGWYKGTVTVHFEATDLLSGIDSVTPDQTISTSGAGQSVIGTAMDLAGNKATGEVKVNIDNDAPISTCSAGGDAWSKTDIQVSFSATDNGGSGVKLTEYSLDGGNWQPAVSIIISKEGQTTIYYRSVDQLGNEEIAKSATVKIDKTLPIITGAPLTQPGNSGWYNSDVTVHFTANDALSGIASVSPDQTLKDEGAHQSVTGVATDKAGNIATIIVSGINIDKSPPLTSCIFEGQGGGAGDNVWYRSNVTVTLAASDGSGIGVDNTEYRVDNGPWTSYTGPFNVIKEGHSYVYFRSTDMLHQQETEQVREVKIDRGYPSISYSIIPPLDKDDWATDTVIVHFTGSDSLSGIGSVTPDIYLSEDGYNQSVVGYAYDMAGNMNWVMVSGINIDRKSPVTMCTLDHTPTADGWFNTSVNASLDAFDNTGSGANWTEYKLNDTQWVKYTPHTLIPIVDDGYNVIYYRSVDNTSHLEPINARSVYIDRAKPAITAKIIGVANRTYDGQEWYTGNVSVHFDAYDNVSGIKSLTPDCLLFNDGKGQVVSGMVSDLAGNLNSSTITINLDKNPPVTDCQLDGTRGNNSWFTSPVKVTLNASDSGSWINYTLYSLDNITWNSYSGPFTISIPGNTTVYYYSVDNINNIEALKTKQIKIDTDKPYLEISKSPSPNSLGWFGGSVTLHAIVTDGISGVAGVTPDKVVATEGGDQVFLMYAWDLAGNVQAVLAIVSIDKTVPVTTCNVQGMHGATGWYGASAKATLSVADVPGASIVTKYSYGIPDNMQTYTGTITISSPGSNTIYYYSVDGAGNKEAVKSTTINIDPLLPDINCTLSGTMGADGWYRSDVGVSFAASDPGLSGLSKAEYSLDGMVWKPIEAITLSKEGLYNIQYRATSNAGVQAVGEQMLGIIKTPPKVLNTTPADGAENVFVDDNVTCLLEGRIDTSTITPDTYYLTSGDEKVYSLVKFNATGQAVLQPLAALEPLQTYTVTLTDGVKDLAGNSPAGQTVWSFTTGDSTRAGDTVMPRPATPTPAPTTSATPTPAPETNWSLPSQLPLLVAGMALLGVVGAGAYYLVVMRK